MYRRISGCGSQVGVVVTAISAVEIALWDLKGNSLGVPVCELLDWRFRDKIRVYCESGRESVFTSEAHTELAKEVKNLDFIAYKFNIDDLFAFGDI